METQELTHLAIFPKHVDRTACGAKGPSTQDATKVTCEACKARLVVELPPSAVDIAWISEYGLRQKLSRSIRCF